MHRFYGAVLRLYPSEYRAAFAGEMLDTFDQASRSVRARGPLAFARFLASESAGLIKGLFSEWIAKSASRYAYMMACPQPLPPDFTAPTHEIAEVQVRLQRVIRCMEYAIAHHDFPKARFYSNVERFTRAKLDYLVRQYNQAAAG